MKCGQILMQADSIFERNVKLPHIDGYAILQNLSLWYKLTGNSKKSLEMIMDQAHQSNLSMKPISMITKMGLSCRIPIFENEDAHEMLEAVLLPIKSKMTDNMIDEDVLKQNSLNQTASTRFIINMVIGKAGKVKKALGPYHPGYASLIKGLIPLYTSIGSVQMEEDLTLEYINILNHNTLQDFSFLSESEKELYFQTRLPEMDDFIAYTLKRKENNPRIACNAYDFVIRNKGLMLKSSTAMRQSILSSNDNVLLGKYDAWLSLQKEISALYATPVEMRGKDVNTLEARANLLEKDLVLSSQTFGEYRKGMQTTWRDVKNNLKTDEAAVEFTNFRVKERNIGSVSYYCALIIRSDSDYPEMIKLFEEDELTAIIGNNQENNLTYINSVYGTRSQTDSSLYKLIWQPLETYLKGVNKVYLSPSGLLYKISFAAISYGKNAYLCDKYQFQIKGSTGNFSQPDMLSSADNLSALVFGGIKYSADNSGSQVWSYLKGTKDEGDAVSEILKKEQVRVRYLTDNTATETFLKNNVKDYSILHVATHGFFFPDPNVVRMEVESEPVEFGAVAFRGAMRGFGVNSFVNNQNPLMRSGLVFAGANDVWNKTEMEKDDDGVLTAQEVTQIDMRKNVLVVLSACETGLGDIKGSEGVYGLQRSFKMAGVKFVLVSLWQVPDKETVEFMESFYSKLLKEKDIRKAFSGTQAEMREKYDPYFWAAFGLIE
jgi:CHAT domain-containing protein